MSATSLNETIAKQKLELRDPMRLNWAQRMEAVVRHWVRYRRSTALFSRRPDRQRVGRRHVLDHVELSA
ncbi:MAG: hypothetical protein L0220_02260, partial [Acidobacteria bacterium]|nr:hypothetical protein [Acidobacteriota bacterium]